MKFKTGDKIKFLNEKGGGIVTGIINNNTVVVSTDDGFEMPFPVKELVNVTSIENPDESIYMESKEIPCERDDNFHERISCLSKNSSVNKKPSGVYLAFVPHAQDLLISGLLDVYLINYTDSNVLYSLYFKEPTNEYYGADCGKLKSQSKLFLETIERNELEEWSEAAIQLMYHQNGSTQIIPPASIDFKVKTIKFLKEDNYQKYSFLDDKALLITVHEYPIREIKPINIDADVLKEVISSNKSTEKPKEKAFIDKYRIDSKTAEVDMHIWELVDDYSRMTNGEMLNIQLNYLTKCLDSAIANHLSKVIFIHGVGNGTLRMEVRKTLDNYEGIEYYDASMAKYGVGATEVVIKHNQ